MAGIWAVTVIMAGISCGDDQPVRPVDCALLCERYEVCVEPIDGAACVTKCEQHAGVSRVYGLAAVSCQDCIAGKTCDEAIACWDTCPVRVDD